jgi:hypothetical protein
VFWKYCLFTEDDYNTIRKKEANANKGIVETLKEIIVPKLLFNDDEMKNWNCKKGAILTDEILEVKNTLLREKHQEYVSKPKYAFMKNGDRIKYGEGQKIIEIFSPRYGFDYIPKKEIEEIKNCPYSWDFYGNYVFFSENEELDVGFQNNFFVMRPKCMWIVRSETNDNYLSEDYGFIKPYIEPVHHQRFKIVQGFKFYRGDEEIWTDEEKFKEWYKSRKPMTSRELFERL